MSEQQETVLEQALTLPAKERVKLVEKLLASLDQPDPVVDALWAEEAEDRIRAYDAGEIKGISAEDLLKKYRKT